MQICNSCGKEILNQSDLTMGNPTKGFCRFCVDELGELKSYEEIFANQVGLLMTTENIDQNTAEIRVKQQLSKVPIWKDKI